MLRIFISYSRDGASGEVLAQKVENYLTEKEFNVFRDTSNLKAGNIWYKEIEEELNASDIVILILSKRVSESKWVHNEINQAEELGIKIIPIISEEMIKPLWVRHIQDLNFKKSCAWDLLLESIYEHPKLKRRNQKRKLICSGLKCQDLDWPEHILTVTENAIQATTDALQTKNINQAIGVILQDPQSGLGASICLYIYHASKLDSIKRSHILVVVDKNIIAYQLQHTMYDLGVSDFIEPYIPENRSELVKVLKEERSKVILTTIQKVKDKSIYYDGTILLIGAYLNIPTKSLLPFFPEANRILFTNIPAFRRPHPENCFFGKLIKQFHGKK